MSKAETASVLSAGGPPGSRNPSYTFHPDSMDDIFVLIGFDLSAASLAPTLDVQDIVLMIDGSVGIRPVGYSDSLEDCVGKFTGSFTPGGADYYVKFEIEPAPGNPGGGRGRKSGLQYHRFVYVVPQKYLDGKHRFQLTIAGLGGVDVAVDPLLPQGYVALSADGKYLAVTRGKNLYFFEASRGTPLWSYTASYLSNELARVSSDGAYILVAGKQDSSYLGPQTVWLFHKSKPEPLWTRNMRAYRTSIISADRSRVGIAQFTEDRVEKVSLLDTSSGNLVCDLIVDSPQIIDIAMSSNGNCIAVATLRNLYLFDGVKGSVIWKHSPSSGFTNFEDVAFTPDGSCVGALYEDSQPPSQPGGQWGSTQEVLMFQRSSSTPIWHHTSSIGSFGAYHSIAFSADGDYMVICSRSTVTLFSRASGSPVWSKKDFPKYVSSVSISSDAGYIGVGCEDGTVYVIDKSGNTLWTGAGIGARVGISGDGKTMAVADTTSVHLLNVADGKLVWTYRFP